MIKIKKLWDVRVTFLYKGKEIKRAPITMVADTGEDARDNAADEVLRLWAPCIVLKVGEATLICDPSKTETAA